MLHRWITLLDALGKRAPKCEARAKVRLVGCDTVPSNVVHPGAINIGVLDELEPWSKDWREWWEDATKVDLDDVEGASNFV